MRKILESIEAEFRRYKTLGEGAMEQLTDAELSTSVSASGNSVATLVSHIAGNFRSRFTDFLTTDGEKPWRNRDSEFVGRTVTRAALMQDWDKGWQTLFKALAPLNDEHLHSSVVIRNQPLFIHDALLRSVTHASYHVGQIVFLAKEMRGDGWKWLSIPPGASDAVNRKMAEKYPPR